MIREGHPRAKLIDPNGTTVEDSSEATTHVQMESSLNGGQAFSEYKDLNPGVSGSRLTAFEVSQETWAKTGWKVEVKADSDFTVSVK
jgi:hypothetical protein